MKQQILFWNYFSIILALKKVEPDQSDVTTILNEKRSTPTVVTTTVLRKTLALYNSESSNETTLLFGPSANVTANEVETTTVGATVVNLDANVTVENFTHDNETLVEEIGTEIQSSADSKYPTQHITILLVILVAFN